MPFSTLPIAPLRTKVSADFGTVNTDISVAAAAGTTYTGTARAFPGPTQGILVNINVDESLVDDLILTGLTIYPFSWRPIRVQAGGFVGWVHTPYGYSMPTMLPNSSNWCVSVKAKVVIPSLIVTTQVFNY